MMGNISILMVIFPFLFFIAEASIMVDLSKISSNEYFSDMNDTEIDKYCNAHHGGRLEQDFCAKRDFEKSDQKLNKTYKRLINSCKNDKKLLSKAKKSQQAWLKYRELAGDDAYTIIGNGTMKNQYYFASKEMLTNEREEFIRGYYFDDWTR